MMRHTYILKNKGVLLQNRVADLLGDAGDEKRLNLFSGICSLLQILLSPMKMTVGKYAQA